MSLDTREFSGGSVARTSNPSSRSAGGERTKGKGKGSPRPRWQRVLLWLVGLGLLAVVAGAGVFAVAYASTDIPDANEFAESQSSIVYYADGQTELARFTGGTNRESVELSDVPEHAQKAMLSAEDRTFYENEGVSIPGTLRAAWTNLTSDTTQGGSTITQQYVKNYYLTSEQSYRRKFEELLISVKIDNELSKDEVLGSYLNTIYYGRGAYGIQTASEAYFDKDASDLNVSEGAFLAAVTNAPSLFDPAYAEGNQERAQERFAYVIDGMVSQGWLSQADGDAAAFPELQSPQASKAIEGPTGYIIDTIRKELVNELNITGDDIDRGGLRITSTIVQKHQDAAETAIAQEMPDSPDADDLKVGLVAITPGDGAITAMYGGADYQEEQLNITTDAQQQAGSLFKVFALIAALEGDVSTRNTYSGASPQQFEIAGQQAAEINNFRDEQFGQIDLGTATANSVNTVYVALNEEIGPENTSRVARELGLPEDTPGLEDNLTNVLGSAAPTMIQMTNAYAAIAAEGELADPYLVVKVTSSNGVYDYTAKPETELVVEADITADVTTAMTRVITEGSGTGAGDLGRSAAGKSGTSSNNLSAWFDGFTPQLAASVMLYQGDGTEPMQDIAGVDQVTGGSFPVSIWGEFMRLALDGDEVLNFPERVVVNDNLRPTPTPQPTPEPTQPEETTAEPSTATETETVTETDTETPEPTEPTEPTETTEPAETTEPPEPPEPSETTEPAETTAPEETTEPTESEANTPAPTTGGGNDGGGGGNGGDGNEGGGNSGGDGGNGAGNEGGGNSGGDGGNGAGNAGGGNSGGDGGDGAGNGGGGNGSDTDPVDGG